MAKNKKLRVGIVSAPPYEHEAQKKPLLNLIEIVCPSSEEVYVLIIGDKFIRKNITNKKIHIIETEYKRSDFIPVKIIRNIYRQLKICFDIINTARDVDIYIFFMASASLLSILTAKVLNKKVVLALAGSGYFADVSKMRGDIYSHFFHLFKTIEKINRVLSDKIIVYTESHAYDFRRYRNKIAVAHRHFIDFDKFKIKKEFNERDNLVGYIGRLSEEKGALNFAKAIPEILEEKNNIKFLIGGDGQLRDKIEEYLDKKNIHSEVKLTGWIPHEKLPEYLNELKLVVLPSYTEGLPNIMLEAMACDTPVLATSVGAIPDIIKDGENGFIMEDNSPECIAENVIRALNHRNLAKIVKNARKLVEKEFTYGAAVERYRRVLGNVTPPKRIKIP